MQLHSFGRLWPVSTLTLGGGGLGMLWGATTFDECVATVHAAVAAGINLLDLAPRYGDGKAEEVVGAAFGGTLPDGLRVTSKCNLGGAPGAEVEGLLRASIEASLTRLRLSRLDLFFLHSNVVPDAEHIARRPDTAGRMTLYRTFVDYVRPALEKLQGEGVIGLGGAPGAEVEGLLRASIEASLTRLRLSRLDLFFLHSNVVPDAEHIARRPDTAGRMTLYRTFVDYVRPALEKLQGEGVIGAWGLTGIGHPDTIIKLLGEAPLPAAVQCIANLLDSPGGLKFFDGPPKPRAVMAAARANGVAVMGIRAVQAGALTDAIDRELPPDHPEMRDYDWAAGFRLLAARLDMSPALLAHRYALSLDIDTLVLGVKNRVELAECVAAAEAGPLPPGLIARIDGSVIGSL